MKSARKYFQEVINLALAPFRRDWVGATGWVVWAIRIPLALLYLFAGAVLLYAALPFALAVGAVAVVVWLFRQMFKDRRLRCDYCSALIARTAYRREDDTGQTVRLCPGCNNQIQRRISQSVIRDAYQQSGSNQSVVPPPVQRNRR